MLDYLISDANILASNSERCFKVSHQVILCGWLSEHGEKFSVAALGRLYAVQQQ